MKTQIKLKEVKCKDLKRGMVVWDMEINGLVCENATKFKVKKISIKDNCIDMKHIGGISNYNENDKGITQFSYLTDETWYLEETNL